MAPDEPPLSCSLHILGGLYDGGHSHFRSAETALVIAIDRIAAAAPLQGSRIR
jgi:hypothetical protein